MPTRNLRASILLSKDMVAHQRLVMVLRKVTHRSNPDTLHRHNRRTAPLVAHILHNKHKHHMARLLPDHTSKIPMAHRKQERTAVPHPDHPGNILHNMPCSLHMELNLRHHTAMRPRNHTAFL